LFVLQIEKARYKENLENIKRGEMEKKKKKKGGGGGGGGGENRKI